MDEILFGWWETNATFRDTDGIIHDVLAYTKLTNQYILPQVGYIKLREKEGRKIVIDFVPF
jgi:hypothetical protein